MRQGQNGQIQLIPQEESEIMHNVSQRSANYSVSEWLVDLKDGDSFAAQKIWTRYLGRLVAFADRKLGKQRLQLADGEDVAIIAFTHFLKGVAKGRFSELNDRDDLWQVLVMLTDRKAKDHLDRENAIKRGAHQTLGESKVDPRDQPTPSLDYLAGDCLTPEFAAQFTEELELKLLALKDAQLVRIAIAKLNGMTNREIAIQEDIGLRTIERRLALIRRIWESNESDE